MKKQSPGVAGDSTTTGHSPFRLERLQEVGLLGLGREPGGGAAPLDVEDDDGELGHHGQRDPLRLQGEPRATGGAAADRSPEGRADDRADGRDLVLRLQGTHPESLVHRQLVEDVAGRGDRVGPVDHRQARPLGGGQDAPGEGPVPGHAPVDPGGHLGRLDAVALAEDLGRLAEVVAGLQGPPVRLGHVQALGEPLLDPVEGRLDGPRVDPRDQPEGEEVLAAVLLPGTQRKAGQAVHGQPGDVDLVQPVPLGQRRIVDGVGRVSGAVQVLLLEGAGVEDEQPALLEVAEVHLQRRRVHGHQAVELVSGGVDPAAAELQLKARDAEERPGRGADLGGEAGKGREVVARPGRLGGELLTGELHAVAGVAREPDHGAIENPARLGDGRPGGHGLAHEASSPR
jgi:hypothetical protein